MTFGLGVAAALAGPLVMTLGFIAWENHWKGSAFALNLFKCNLASVGFLILACTTRSDPFPKDVFTLESIGYMILSSTIGIIIGDWTWLEALQLLGARKCILMDSLKPFLAAFLGWLILDEELRPEAFLGIALTVAGVLVVSLETTGNEEVEEDGDDNDDNNNNTNSHDSKHETLNETDLVCLSTGVVDPIQAIDGKPSSSKEESDTEGGTQLDMTEGTQLTKRARDLRLGYPYAILNVVLDTYGAVLIKQHGQAFKVWEINLLRFGFAGIFMLLVSLGMSTIQCLNTATNSTKQAQWHSLPLLEMNIKHWFHASLGVLLVTFATPSLSNYALFEVALALALTLGSVGPLYSLPLSYLLQNDRPTIRSGIGAFLAVAGVVVLTWRGTGQEDT